MQFDREFFDPETRCGFEISSEMKHCWAAEIELLDFLQFVCGKFGLTYYAVAGTLLGAVRHGGYIPWDDDIDICMMRKDFNILMDLLPRVPAPFLYINSNRIAFHDNVISNVANGEMVPLPDETVRRFHGCPYVVGIDILILDNIPRDRELRDSQMLLAGTVYKTISYYDDIVSSGGLEDSLREIENMFGGVTIDRSGNIKHQLYILFDKTISLFDDSESDEVAIFQDQIIFQNPVVHRRECFGKGRQVPFENTFINVPDDYDSILRANFGPDYMTPVMTGGTHGYPIYKAQKAYLEEHGYDFGQYNGSFD